MRSPCRTGVLFAAFVYLLACEVEGRGERFRSTSGSSPAAPGLAPTLAQAVSCQPLWLPTFGGRPGVSAQVEALTTFDAGSGPTLVVGGRIGYAGGHLVSGISAWDGATWSTLAGGVGGVTYPEVDALAVFDDGSGLALYAGGLFTTAGGVDTGHLARWNGVRWARVGAGIPAQVRSLIVFDDGTGPALYAGGEFTTAGGVAANNIAKWDGTQWSAVGLGTGGSVRALSIFDDGGGACLVAAGVFAQAGGLPAAHIAKWNGSSWTALGAGISGPVYALAVHDDGSGRALYAGGWFGSAGGVLASYVARWAGGSWGAVGTGFDSDVYALAVYDDGSGPALYAGGQFTSAGGTLGSPLAKWDGSAWSALPSELAANNVHALATFDDGAGTCLVAGGSVYGAGTGNASGLARWNGQRWRSCSDGGLDWAVQALATHDDGHGPALFAGGWFTHAGDTPLPYIGRWDGADWHALGSGTDGTVLSLTAFDDGTGPVLCVGGAFSTAGGTSANHVASWDGISWSPLGSGLDGLVHDLVVFDAGMGPALYAGGSFRTSAGTVVNCVAAWNGTTWAPLGTGMSDTVHDLAVYDDGNGSRLYAGGTFLKAGGVNAKRIARWNGSQWSALGSGTDGDVYALATHDDGQGLALFAGGSFTQAGGIWAPKVARLDSHGWSALGNGPGPGSVQALASLDVFGTRLLFVGGVFDIYAGAVGSGVVTWDGAAWSALGHFYPWYASVGALAVHDDGGGRALYAGGAFVSCSESGDSFLAKWGLPAGCGWSGAVVCEPGVGGVLLCPCANPPASAARGCDNAAGSGGAHLEAHGHSSLSSDALVFTTSGEPATATSLVLQGDVLLASGASFGQGVRCLGGALKRLYVKSAVSGSITAPAAGDASVSARSALLGDAIVAGTRRYYGVHYRAAQVLGGCPATSTFNVTQQLDVLWQP